MAEDKNKRWEMRFPRNYQEYFTVTEGYLANGFKRREGDPVPEKETSRLVDLAAQGYDAVGITHFDENHQEVKGKMEVYVRARR